MLISGNEKAVLAFLLLVLAVTGRGDVHAAVPFKPGFVEGVTSWRRRALF
jgi:hypothetical protein